MEQSEQHDLDVKIVELSMSLLRVKVYIEFMIGLAWTVAIWLFTTKLLETTSFTWGTIMYSVFWGVALRGIITTSRELTVVRRGKKIFAFLRGKVDEGYTLVTLINTCPNPRDTYIIGNVLKYLDGKNITITREDE